MFSLRAPCRDSHYCRSYLIGVFLLLGQRMPTPDGWAKQNAERTISVSSPFWTRENRGAASAKRQVYHVWAGWQQEEGQQQTGENGLSKNGKNEREESVCQQAGGADHEVVKLKRSATELVSTNSEDNNGTSPSSTLYDSRTEIQKSVLEPGCLKKVCAQPNVESSLKKPARAKVYSYDETEPTDDDVIMHILRLRGKLGWQTKLPSCECLTGEADGDRLQKFALTRPLLTRDSGECIYCLQKNRNNLRVPYNPYSLQPVCTNTAMHSKEYWTITASFVSKFYVNQKLGEMETTPISQWLRERHLYYRLLNLNLFSNFR
ncbi:UNVERIFIED_CONTAM: hypothetical protein H355_000825 [Colinus virginianus]|nr:hypothetical protein H355_000825 [Colinus virginianus]